MKNDLFILAALAFSFIFPSAMRADPTPAERVAQIQAALQTAKLDGWLFYDFRGSDPLALRILRLDSHAVGSRRWFYYIPESGEPTKIVHSIERYKLDALPGKRLIYRGWQEHHSHLRRNVVGMRPRRDVRCHKTSRSHRDAVFPDERHPLHVARRRRHDRTRPCLRPEVVTSAELVQQFEAVWTPAQKQSHIEASDKTHRIIMEAFAEIATPHPADEPVTEYDIQQFIVRRWTEEGMIPEPGIVAVNANSANPHYAPTKESTQPIKRAISS